jgi:hypothetical protein
MRISTSTSAAVIALVGVALFSATPAIGESGRSQATADPSAAGSGRGKMIRDGSSAVPFDPNPVPNTGRPSTGATERDGLAWGDAALATGSALSVMLLASGAVILARRRGHPGAQPTVQAERPLISHGGTTT